MKNAILLLALTLAAACATQEHDLGEAGPQAGAAAVGVNAEPLASACLDSLHSYSRTWWRGTNANPTCSGAASGNWSCYAPGRTWNVQLQSYGENAVYCDINRWVTGSGISPYRFKCTRTKSTGKHQCARQ